jgi:hypothetical protein
MPSETKDIRGALTPAEVRSKINELCVKRNYNPFEELIRLATETVKTEVNGKMVELPICDVDQKILIAKEIASFLAPKLKSIEVDAHIDGDFTFKVKHFDELGNEVKPVTIEMPRIPPGLLEPVNAALKEELEGGSDA